MATRLANFISAFLQVVDPKEVFPGTRVVDKPLTEDQMIGNRFEFLNLFLDKPAKFKDVISNDFYTTGEAVALVMGDTRIWSAGIYWDQNKFPNRTYFAPYAYKEELNTRKFKVISRLHILKHKDSLFFFNSNE